MSENQALFLWTRSGLSTEVSPCQWICLWVCACFCSAKPPEPQLLPNLLLESIHLGPVHIPSMQTSTVMLVGANHGDHADLIKWCIARPAACMQNLRCKPMRSMSRRLWAVSYLYAWQISLGILENSLKSASLWSATYQSPSIWQDTPSSCPWSFQQ